jgi:hypothetical protein
MLPSVVALLNAMEGIAYLTDVSGVILAVGQPGWDEFASDNGAAELHPSAVVGMMLFETMSVGVVREAFVRLHSAVATGRRNAVTFEYRCDSPIAERHMRMSITSVRSGGRDVEAVLYQSQMVSEIIRPMRPIFDPASRPERQEPGAVTVLLCAICQRVAWPQVTGRPLRRWVEVVDYYRRGGTAATDVEDTICPNCDRTVVRPNS